MERKDFIKKFAVGGSILLTAPVLFNSCSDDDDPTDDNNNNTNNPNEIVIDLSHADYSALGAVGGYAYKGDIIIFRTGDNAYSALSKLCTHSECTITYNHASNELPCPCHGSKFNTSGTVLTGPASSNLKSYTIKKEGNQLKIS